MHSTHFKFYCIPMSHLPAIKNSTYEDIKDPKLDPLTCRFKFCNNLFTNNCSQSLCCYRFCEQHASHNHFGCEYCIDNLAVCYIKSVDRIACENCKSMYLDAKAQKHCVPCFN